MIRAFIVGDAAVVQKLQELPEKMRRSLTAAVAALAADLERHVKQDKLSGQVLHRRSPGGLSSSINNRVTQTSDSVTGQVGTNKQYAAFHEYGYHGSQQIKEHLRQIKQAFGRPIEPRQVVIQAHTREVNYPAHSFLRSALKDMEPQIKAGLEKAVTKALKE